MKITTLLLLACLVVAVVARPKARPQDADYEDEPAPARKPAVKTNPLLNRRGPLTRGGAKTTTTTTTEAPLEDEEIEEEGELEEEIIEPTTTTEAPKRLKGGIVRPFRSNDDLLAALKRRREQASSGKLHSTKSHDNSEPEQVREEPTAAPKRAQSGRRNRFSASTKNTEEQEAESAPAPSPARAGRRFTSRS